MLGILRRTAGERARKREIARKGKEKERKREREEGRKEEEEKKYSFDAEAWDGSRLLRPRISASLRTTGLSSTHTSTPFF